METMTMALLDLHEHAYGLNRMQHEKVVWAANNHYTESYIALKFNVPVEAVRDICLKGGVIPQRIEELPDGTWKNHPAINT